MPRYAPAITLDQLKSLCNQKLGIGTEDFDPYEFPAYIQNDLSKVQFDLENWRIGNADPNYSKYPSDHDGLRGYPCGYEVLPNGLPVLFVNAGGDWELIPSLLCSLLGRCEDESLHSIRWQLLEQERKMRVRF